MSVFDWTLVLYTHPSKSVSHLQAGQREGICMEAAWNLGRPDPQSPAAFCTLLQVDVHQSQSQTSQLHHFWNALLMWTSRQFFQKYQPGVLILGETHQKTGNGKRLWGEDTLWSPTQCHVWSLQLEFSWPEKTLLTARTFSILHGIRKCYGPPLNLWRQKNLHEEKRQRQDK